jgi:hypothetical protein
MLEFCKDWGQTLASALLAEPPLDDILDLGAPRRAWGHHVAPVWPLPDLFQPLELTVDAAEGRDKSTAITHRLPVTLGEFPALSWSHTMKNTWDWVTLASANWRSGELVWHVHGALPCFPPSVAASAWFNLHRRLSRVQPKINHRIPLRSVGSEP